MTTPGVSDRDLERLVTWMSSPAFTDFMARDSTHLIAHDATTRFARADLAPAPAAHARDRQSASTLSSWRTCPNVNARRNVPNVDGAAT
jgi:hypothetical protein